MIGHDMQFMVQSVLTLNSDSWNGQNIYSPAICDYSDIFGQNSSYNHFCCTEFQFN